MRRLLACMLLALVMSFGYAAQKMPVRPTAGDKCPVCGMFTAMHKDFLAEIIFKDGSYVTFDGPKDMFKYYFDLGKYDKARKLSDIESIYVTEYYGLELIDAYKAFFVAGSDVRGPMGNELIPFSKEADAAVFQKDHKGKEIIDFNGITRAMIQGLDRSQ